MKKIILRTVVLVAIVILSFVSHALTVKEVVDPRAANSGWVTDQGGVLGGDYVKLINDVATALESVTGDEMAVVTVPNMSGEPIENFAVELFKLWGVGKKGKDNGILILVSRDERKARIEVGYGLEGVINDAKAGRLMDENMTPRFRSGEYGMGVYELAKAVAGTIATAETKTLGINDPPIFPVQVEIPKPVENKISNASVDGKPLNAAVFIYVLSAAGLALLLVLIKLMMAFVPRAKTSKQKAIWSTVGAIVVFWVVGIAGIIGFVSVFDSFLLPFAGVMGSTVFATIIFILINKPLKRYVENYKPNCSKCGRPMKMVSESADDKYLKKEEAAEEKAGGMNYEFWRCESCNEMKRYDVTLGKAAKCSKCGRRTLKSKTITLVAATYSQGGKVRTDHWCVNPGCGNKFSKESSTAKLSRSSSGRSSSSGSSSGSSFGGGASGGGGASRSW